MFGDDACQQVLMNYHLKDILHDNHDNNSFVTKPPSSVATSIDLANYILYVNMTNVT